MSLTGLLSGLLFCINVSLPVRSFLKAYPFHFGESGDDLVAIAPSLSHKYENSKGTNKRAGQNNRAGQKVP